MAGIPENFDMIDFCEGHFSSHAKCDDEHSMKELYNRLAEKSEPQRVNEEITAIARNMHNCVFPGIYTDDNIEALGLCLGIETSSGKMGMLNSKYQKLLPDITIPFYSLVGYRQEQSLSDALFDKRITEIFTIRQLEIIESTVTSLTKEFERSVQEGVFTNVCAIIYKKYTGCSWKKISATMSKQTCHRWRKKCESLGLIEALRIALQGEHIGEHDISALLQKN